MGSADTSRGREMEFRLLGPVEVLQGGTVLPVGGPKPRGVLAILLLHANETVLTDSLIEELWGEQPPPTADAALRVHITQLRRALSSGGATARLVTRRNGYILEVGPDELDLDGFERLVASARSALAEGRWGEASAVLHEALRLWRGPPLGDLRYEPFAQPVIARLEELRLGALETRIEADLALGLEASLVGELEGLVAIHPLRERLRGQLMVALYRCGRQAEALETYRATRRALIEELGIDPSPALRLLERNILRQDPSLQAPTVQAVSSGDADEGDAKRPLSVIVADLSAAGGDDEVPTPVLGHVLDAVFEHRGRIESPSPANLVALFGLPLASEDDAERATLAALEIRGRLRRTGIEVVVAVATGVGRQAVVADAQSLLVGAAPGRVIVNRRTRRLVRLSFEFDAIEASRFEVLRPVSKPQKTRGIEGLRADLWGREHELAELQAALAAARAGNGQLVLIGGEAGVGKSRLVAELRDGADTDLRWLEGRCRASGTATSYLPYIELLAQEFGWTPDDDERKREARVLAALAQLLPLRARELAPLLAHLFTLPGAAALDGVPPEQLRNRTVAAVRELLLALSRQRPLVLVLEDLHWADNLSVELTSFLMESLPTAALLLVCVLRPDPPHLWQRLTILAAQKCGPAYRQLEIAELSREQTLGLLRALLPLEQPSQDLEELILGRCQGNPFFLEEILQSLIDEGAVTRANGRWRARGDIDAVAVPESVQAVIVSRFDRLRDERRQVLETAAVVGRSFPRRLLADLVDDDELDARLWELERLGLVFEDRVLPEEEYSFKHVLTQEAIYRTLPESQCRVLHQKTADAIEALYADSLEERYEELAYHCERGTAAPKAAEYLYRAGEKSRRAFVNDDAIDYFERARALLGRLRDAARPWRSELAARIDESLGEALELTSRHADAVVAYEQALALTRARDRLRRARLLRKMADSLRLQRHVDEARKRLDQAQETLGAAPPHANKDWWEERCAIEFNRLMADYFFAPDQELAATVASARRLIEAHGTPLQSEKLLEMLAILGAHFERFPSTEETLGYAQRLLKAAKTFDDPGVLASAQFALGFRYVNARGLDRAGAALEEGLRLAERAGDRRLQTRCLAYLTLAARLRGDVHDVRALAPRTLERAEDGQLLEYVAHARANLAWLAVREGDLRAAEREANIAWELWSDLHPIYRLIRWVPLWPRIAVSLSQQRLHDAFADVAQLLEEENQPVPDELRQALESAMRAWIEGDAATARSTLTAATPLAARYGYV